MFYKFNEKETQFKLKLHDLEDNSISAKQSEKKAYKCQLHNLFFLNRKKKLNQNQHL